MELQPPVDSLLFLLAQGADVNARNSIGLTALDFAWSGHWKDGMAVLRAAGAKETERTSKPIGEARNG